MATRWRWPPDSSVGRRRPISMVRPTRASISSTLLAISAPPMLPWARRGMATIVSHARQRIERGEGVLEDRLDQARARLAVHVDHAPAFDRDVAGRGFEQAEDQPRQGGLAAARFAHHAQHAALRHGEGDVVDRHDVTIGAEHPALDAEGLAHRHQLDGGDFGGGAHAGNRHRKVVAGRGGVQRHGMGAGRVGEVAAARGRRSPRSPGRCVARCRRIEPSGSSRLMRPGTGTQRSRPCV